MTFDIEMLKVVVEVVQGLVVLAGVFIYVKKGQYDDAANILQSVFTHAVSKVQCSGVNQVDMKAAAMRIVANSLEDSHVAQAVKKLGIKIETSVIGDMIERTLSSGKLGVANPIKDLVKSRGRGALLGFLSQGLNTLKV